MIIRLVHLIALSFLIGILFLISVSEARGVFTAYGQSMVLSEAKSRECPGPVPGSSMTIITPTCNSKKQSTEIVADRTPQRIQVPKEDNLRIQLLPQSFMTNDTNDKRSFVRNIVYDRIDYLIYDSTDQRAIVKDIADRVDPEGSLSKIINATSSAGAIVKYNPTLRGEKVSATCLPSSGSMFPIGNNSIKCTAIDKQGTMVMQRFVITVAA